MCPGGLEVLVLMCVSENRRLTRCLWSLANAAGWKRHRQCEQQQQKAAHVRSPESTGVLFLSASVDGGLFLDRVEKAFSRAALICPTHSVLCIHTEAPEQSPTGVGTSPLKPEADCTVKVVVQPRQTPLDPATTVMYPQ